MKQIQACLALALLLLTGLNCGTENPLEETGDTLAVETVATGAFSGEIELIGDETIYVRVLKTGQLIAQMEFAKGYTKGATVDGFQGELSTESLGEIGTYRLKETELGDYTLQISAKGYQTMELNVTITADQSILLDKIALVVLDQPVSHLQGILTDAATGVPISQVHLQLTDKAGEVYKALTTGAGVFTFENLPVEQAFTLSITHAGYEGKEVAVHPIPAAETLELQVQLTRRAEPEKLDPGQGLSLESQAPAFELPDGDGKLHALADYVGNKNVVLVFYRGGW
ncbi:redoxin domain-containing protein [Candidatus Poribacteria bacterium]|nr:redoxin domain-containing protein [Candidatus Poribacteria bacterium]